MVSKRGRKSSADMAVAPPVQIDAKRQRPPTPDGLGKPEAEIWKRIVSSMPAGWFGGEHRELLERYCEHQCRAARFSRIATKLAGAKEVTAEDLQRIDKSSQLAERESRASLALARSMRITHQAQLRAETANTRRQNATAQRPPWFD